MSVSDDLNGLNNLPFLGVRPLDVTMIDSFATQLTSVYHPTKYASADTISIKDTHSPSPESLGLTVPHLPLVSPVFISGPDWSVQTAVFARPLSSRLASGAILNSLPCPGLLFLGWR